MIYFDLETKTFSITPVERKYPINDLGKAISEKFQCTVISDGIGTLQIHTELDEKQQEEITKMM